MNECRHWNGKTCANPKAADPNGVLLGPRPTPTGCQRCVAYDGPPRSPDARPPITPAKVAAAARAILTGKRVSLAVLQARITICSTCEHQRTDATGATFCGICGCTLSSDAKRTINLAAIEENLPAWGCKHPERSNDNGKGWPK